MSIQGTMDNIPDLAHDTSETEATLHINEDKNNKEGPELSSSVSISSSISSYSPETHDVTSRQSFTTSNSQVIRESVDPVGMSTLHEQMKLSYDSFVNGSQSQLVGSESRDSIKTFSSEEEDELKEEVFSRVVQSSDKDYELFESFSGSTKDFATTPINSTRVDEETENILKKYSDADNNTPLTASIESHSSFTPSIPKFTVRQTSKDEFTPLNVNKLRGNLESNYDPKRDPQYRNLSRSITPVTYSGPDALTKRLEFYEEQLKQTETKHSKLEKEIYYVKSLLHGRELEESVEMKKMRYALGKLEDRLKDTTKERYDLGIKITKYRRRAYGDENGSLTEYFVRKVSLD